METIKFNEKETIALWCGIKHAICHEKQDLRDFEKLNEKGGFTSVIRDIKMNISALEKIESFLRYQEEIKIEGD